MRRVSEGPREKSPTSTSRLSPTRPPPARTHQLPTGGTPLPATTRARLEPQLGHDFSRIRIHDDTRAHRLTSLTRARAFTVGDHISFAAGRYQPSTPAGTRLLAHELTHSVHQRRGAAGNAHGSTAALEREADLVASSDGRVAIRGAAPTYVPQFAFVDDLKAAWDPANKKKFFDLLRAHGADPDPAIGAALVSLAPALGPDDLWLAQAIALRGPETLWEPALISERVKRAKAGAWAAEPGNIEAELPDPYPDAGKTSPSVHAYFFPGQTDARALVIGGVHGSELSGVEVANRLRAQLAKDSAAGKPPWFTTIIVPEVMPRALAARRKYEAKQKAAGQPFKQFDNTARPVTDKPGHEADPNRNFPQPGTSLSAAHALGTSRKDKAELLFTDDKGVVRPPKDKPRFPASQRMMPETRILLALIERFKPQRIASVHAHWLGTSRGDAPGVFVDPRGGFDEKTDAPAAGAAGDAGRRDDALARRMLTTGQGIASGNAALSGAKGSKDPFSGNKSTKWPGKVKAPYTAVSGSPTVHYTSTEHGEGTSLGGWAPAQNITTVTVEVPQYDPWDPSEAAKLDAAIDAHRDVLEQVFLGQPKADEPQ